MATALIHLDAKQKTRMARRRRNRRRPFSHEVRNAGDLYLPAEAREESGLLAPAADESAARSRKSLDETIAYLHRILKSMRQSR